MSASLGISEFVGMSAVKNPDPQSTIRVRQFVIII